MPAILIYDSQGNIVTAYVFSGPSASDFMRSNVPKGMSAIEVDENSEALWNQSNWKVVNSMPQKVVI